ncbi:MAG TPA: hypothetical protein VHL54_00235 [Actinomycetota bacterium]|nr:hypothetical protein [Actinomycetota bacterium]
MHISDGDFDKILSGRSGPASPEAAELARMKRELNAAYVRPVPPATESRHLSAILQANQNRSRPGAAGAGAGLDPVLAPLRQLASGFRLIGFVRLSGSTAVWVVALSMFLVTATGGLAAAGVLPDPIQSAVSSAAATVGITVPEPDPAVNQVEVDDPLPPGGVAVTESDLAVQRAALAAAEQSIQAAEQAQKAAQEAAATSARCIEDAMGQVSAMVDGILAATSQAQAQAVVNQARSIGGNVKACADQAASVGQAGVGHATQAAALAQRATDGRPELSPQAQAAIDAARKAAHTAESSASRAFGMSQSIVDSVTNLTAGLINSSLGLQQAINPPVPQPGKAPAAPPSAAPPPPGRMTDPVAWTNWGMGFANQVMSSFLGGANMDGPGRGPRR